ncbi:MAG: hypothetical protein WKF43_02505 [Acidimicrobiales bacterium]
MTSPRSPSRASTRILCGAGGKRDQGLSPKSVRNTHVALRKALADAERLELIDRHPAGAGEGAVG